MDLRIAGEDDVLSSLPLADDGEACCAVERLRDLPAQSIRLRTRALTTTMFARYFLGDLFIHGIGGAKYDELGDEISARFFGSEPPGFLTMSLTLRLGLPTSPETPDDLRHLDRTLRDLTFNPDRHLDEPYPVELRTIIAAKRAALAGPAPPVASGSLASWPSAIPTKPCSHGPKEGGIELRARRAAILAGLRSNRVARSREFAAVLHSAGRLRESSKGSVADLKTGQDRGRRWRAVESLYEEMGWAGCAGACDPAGPPIRWYVGKIEAKTTKTAAEPWKST